jgi:ankyrin repeat protein
MPPSKKRSYEEIESVRLESLEEQVSKLIKSNESLRNDVHILTKENSTMRKEMKDLIGRNENFQGRITSLEISRREIAITHLQLCIARRDQCEIDLINFRRKYSETVINADPILHSRHIELMKARKEAWEAYFKAYDALYPKTIEDILWIMAKAGHTKLVAPLMNLSKVTRNCIHLQPIMMNVKNMYGRTQLHHCAINGLTTSVKRLLSIRNINVNVKDDLREYTPLHFAAWNGHVEIARLLLQNGAEVDAKSYGGYTPLHCAAEQGNVDILHLLVENGANLEAQSNDGWRALHHAAWWGNLRFIQELISRYHVDINARKNDGRTALSWARMNDHPEIITFLRANGGI